MKASELEFAKKIVKSPFKSWDGINRSLGFAFLHYHRNCPTECCAGVG